MLVEGYKTADIPKIEAYRAETGKQPLALENGTIVAVAYKGRVAVDLPTLDLDDTGAMPTRLKGFWNRSLRRQAIAQRLLCSAPWRELGAG